MLSHRPRVLGLFCYAHRRPWAGVGASLYDTVEVNDDGMIPTVVTVYLMYYYDRQIDKGGANCIL